jgi:cysteine-rich repeat protein
MRFSLLTAALLALVGCTANDHDVAKDPLPLAQDTDEPDDSDPPPPPVEPGLILRIASGDGEVIPVMPLSVKDEAYIRILGQATAADIVDADYVFQVLDLNGNVVSSDEPACRRFHLNQFGRIDLVYEGQDAAGAVCSHRFGIADNSSLVIQLVPFADVAADANGVMSYVVEALPVQIETSNYKLSTTLSVLAPAEPEPTCGDGIVDEGEACDDGNEDEHDGCTTSCTKSPC